MTCEDIFELYSQLILNFQISFMQVPQYEFADANNETNFAPQFLRDLLMGL